MIINLRQQGDVLGPQRSAQHYYDEAHSAAHDAQNVELVTYILCTMSHLATWQGKPRIGIDHAVAAAVWAEQAQNPIARAYAADVAVRAYVADTTRRTGTGKGPWTGMRPHFR